MEWQKTNSNSAMDAPSPEKGNGFGWRKQVRMHITVFHTNRVKSNQPQEKAELFSLMNLKLYTTWYNVVSCYHPARLIIRIVRLDQLFSGNTMLRYDNFLLLLLNIHSTSWLRPWVCTRNLGRNRFLKNTAATETKISLKKASILLLTETEVSHCLM